MQFRRIDIHDDKTKYTMNELKTLSYAELKYYLQVTKGGEHFFEARPEFSGGGLIGNKYPRRQRRSAYRKLSDWSE